MLTSIVTVFKLLLRRMLMRKLLILGSMILSSCSGAKPVYTFYCATPVGLASGDGTFTNTSGYATAAQFTTETGVTVISPWYHCVAVKK